MARRGIQQELRALVSLGGEMHTPAGQTPRWRSENDVASCHEEGDQSLLPRFRSARGSHDLNSKGSSCQELAIMLKTARKTDSEGGWNVHFTRSKRDRHREKLYFTQKYRYFMTSEP